MTKPGSDSQSSPLLPTRHSGRYRRRRFCFRSRRHHDGRPVHALCVVFSLCALWARTCSNFPSIPSLRDFSARYARNLPSFASLPFAVPGRILRTAVILGSLRRLTRLPVQPRCVSSGAASPANRRSFFLTVCRKRGLSFARIGPPIAWDVVCCGGRALSYATAGQHVLYRALHCHFLLIGVPID